MSENFESTYEDSLKKTVTGSRVVGGMYDDFELPIPNQDFWEYDGISLTGNPGPYAADTISFDKSLISGSMGEDHISFSPTFTSIATMPEDTNKNGFWKYEENKTLKEIEQYLSSTYQSHYTSQESKTQTLDLIESIGDGEPFCRSNAIKYLSRFGKKNGKSKQDILKAIHYCILLYHFAGLHKNTIGDYPY